MARYVDDDVSARLKRLATPTRGLPRDVDAPGDPDVGVAGQWAGWEEWEDPEELPSARAGERRRSTPSRVADRAGAWWRELPTRLRLANMHLLVLVVLAASGLLVTGWYVLSTGGGDLASALPAPANGQSPEASEPSGSPGASATPLAGGGKPTPSGDTSTIVVHVLGAVRRPGVVELPANSRVTDALKAAGGLTAAARPGELNLAQKLADGQQIFIGDQRSPGGQVRPGGTGAPDAPTSSGASPKAGGKVNLNTANEGELTTLPGIGPVTAKAIISWRTASGPFTSVRQLDEVDGIGPRMVERLEPLVTI